MSDCLGNKLKLMIFGESHGDYIGASISSLPPGIKIDEELIEQELEKRKANDAFSTARQESDNYKIISGVYNGFTTGTSLTVIIPNTKQHSGDYEKVFRPGHADYTGFIKYKGFNDPRGGGHFSGRLTAPLVVIGAIIKTYLLSKNIYVVSRIKKIHNVEDNSSYKDIHQLLSLDEKIFPVLDQNKISLMKEEISLAKDELDSVGGVIETYVINVPRGLGEPFFDSVESSLSHAIFSIPAVKGIEFGEGFNFASLRGSDANDQMNLINDEVHFLTNHNGGINGGITNGEIIDFKTVIKPTPSIYKAQQSVSYDPLKNITLEIKGRHDPCIVRRALPVINALTSFTILDLLLEAGE